MRRCLPLLIAVFLVRCDRGEGATCYEDAECGGDEYCVGAAPSHGCEEGHPGECRERLGEGEVCGSSWSPNECRDGLVCHFGTLPPECRPPSPPGGACRYDGDCDEDLDGLISPDDPVCVLADHDGDEPGTCGPPGSVATGGPCRDERACVIPDGCIDRVCRGPGAEGEHCPGATYPPEDRPECAPGLYCDWGERICRRFLAAGERCWSEDGRCADGLFCYSREAVCHAPLGEGEACIGGDVCAEGLFCSSRAVCQPPIAAGEACWGTDRCVEGTFCYSREAVCHAPLGDGEPCEPFHDVCAAGLVCDSTAEVCRAGP